MIKKIICPTDFSDSSQNAIAYAAKLCQGMQTTLHLLHIEPMLVADQLFSPRKITDDVQNMSQELNNTCNEINRLFNISCETDVDTSGLSLEDAIGQLADEDKLVVIGTNGADSLSQKLLGSNAYQVVTQTFPATLVIPDKVEFATVRKIVFAWEYDINKQEVIRLQRIATQIGCHLEFLHVSKNDSEISSDVYHGLKNKIEEDYGMKGKVDYKRLVNDDVFTAIESYMQGSEAQILGLSMKNGRLVRRILQGGEGGSRLPLYPVLIVHHE